MSTNNKQRKQFTVNRCLIEDIDLYGVNIGTSTRDYILELEYTNIDIVEGETYVGDIIFSIDGGDPMYITNISHIPTLSKIANKLIERNNITSSLLKQIITREISNVITFSKKTMDLIEEKVCECKEADKGIVQNFRRWLENEIIIEKIGDLIPAEEIDEILSTHINLRKAPWELLVGENIDKIFEELFTYVAEAGYETDVYLKLLISYCYRKEITISKKLYILHVKLVDQVQRLLKKRKVKIDSPTIIQSILKHEDLFFEAETAQNIFIYSLKNWQLKKELHQLIVQMQGRDCTIKDKEYSIETQYDEEQRNAIEYSLNSPISIITGGAGTGKTYTVQEIIRCYRAQFPIAKIKIVAPTGKAMNCVKSRMGEVDADIEIGTIHRILGLSNGEQRKFKINADLLIVDETSMVGIENFIRLLRSVLDNKNLRIVIVGDVNQLPPVDLGAVLPELLLIKEIPVIRLTQIYRQAGNSAIIKNAYRIIAGNSELEWVRDEFEFYGATDKEISKELEAVIKSLIDNKIPVQQIQILSAINGEINGVDHINTKIQELMTGETQNALEVGTKVMNIVNNYDKDIYNGETGIITKIIESTNCKAITVRYTVGNSVKEIEYINEEIDEIRQAFCTTIHKMQGSEEEAVILVVPKAHFKMLDRRKLYVAVTRAKERLIIVGDKKSLQEIVCRKIDY